MNSVSDESQVKDLRDQVEAEIDAVCLDGAYDAQTCYDWSMSAKSNQLFPRRKGLCSGTENGFMINRTTLKHNHKTYW